MAVAIQGKEDGCYIIIVVMVVVEHSLKVDHPKMSTETFLSRFSASNKLPSREKS